MIGNLARLGTLAQNTTSYEHPFHDLMKEEFADELPGVVLVFPGYCP